MLILFADDPKDLEGEIEDEDEESLDLTVEGKELEAAEGLKRIPA